VARGLGVSVSYPAATAVRVLKRTAAARAEERVRARFAREQSTDPQGREGRAARLASEDDVQVRVAEDLVGLGSTCGPGGGQAAAASVGSSSAARARVRSAGWRS
jgi:hypothetical protein